MVLQKRLFQVLSDNDEPLLKRLKIADNVFKSELNIRNKLMFLLKWGSQVSSNNFEALQQCYSWLCSENFRALNVNDVTREDLHTFLLAITQQFEANTEDKEILNFLLLIIEVLLESTVYQHYFRNNVESYLLFLTKAITNINDVGIIVKLLQNESIFGKKVVVLAKFHDVFMLSGFPVLVKQCVKFQNEELFELISCILQKNVFARRQQQFEAIKILSKSSYTILEVFMVKSTKLKKKYLYYHYKLVFDAFCKSCKGNPNVRFGFFIILLGHIGFPLKNQQSECHLELDVALEILAGLLEVVSVNSFVDAKLETKTINVTSPDVMQHLLASITVQTKTPINENCYKLIKLIIKISPLTIEEDITSLLKYLMCHNNEKNAELYEQILSGIFDVFNRLHRVEKLISKLIKALQPVYLNEELLNGGEKHEYLELDVDKILPVVVLEKFSHYTLGFSIVQIVNLFKIFISTLNEVISSDLAEKSKNVAYVTFIEIVSRLLCQFLSKMNISSNTIRSEFERKFSKMLRKQEKVLENFGTALVGIEHNQNLMRVFLTLCYTWGELKILFNYTLKQRDDLKIITEVDITTCNISSLHSYLPANVWCLIAERISNFGELTCKEIIEKLWIQKIRALVLDGNQPATISEHVASFVKTITPIENYYKYLTSNNFAINAVMAEMDMNTLIAIADCTINDIAATHNQHIVGNIAKNMNFTIAVLYCLLQKINKLFKKTNQNNETVSRIVYSHISDNFISDAEEVHDLKYVFTQLLEKTVFSTSVTVNEAILDSYLVIIKQLPVVFLAKRHQKLLFIYLYSVLFDLKRNGTANNHAFLEIETILMGIMQTKIISLNEILETQTMLRVVLQDFTQYHQGFVHLLESTNDTLYRIETLRNAIQYLLKDLEDYKHMKCFLIFLKHIQKNKKSKLKELKIVLQENKTNICDTLLTMMNQTNDSPALEVLMILIQIDSIDPTEKTIAYLLKHLEMIFSNVTVEIKQGELALFQLILQNPSALLLDDNDAMTLVNKVGLSLHRVKLSTELIDPCSCILLSILQRVDDVEEFKLILDELLQQTISTFENKEHLLLRCEVWHKILSSYMKLEKAKGLQQVIEKLMLSIYEQLDIAHDREPFFKVLIGVQQHLIQNIQQLLTSTSLDLCFATITKLMMVVKPSTIEINFTQCANLLEALLKHREPLIFDRLPIFLQQYRMLLRCLCQNSDTKGANSGQQLERMGECAHHMEKLTINLCKLKMHMASVAMYLIADILKEYETITLYPAVKLGLNKCLYTLLGLCSHHDNVCLMRVLSPGSTEIFKGIYDDYKKYHKFTGKV